LTSPLLFFQSGKMNVGLAVVLSALLLIAVVPFALALTISGDKDEYNPGDQLTVSGTAGPNADITFKVSNPNGAQVAVGQSTADSNGDFSVTLLRFPSAASTTFPFGSYTVTATADEGTAELTVTLTEAAVIPSQPAASSESGGFAVAVTSEGTYNSGDTVSIFVLTTDNGVLIDATISVARVQAPSGSENVLSTCSKVSTGLQKCSYNVAGGVGTYGVLVQANSNLGSAAAVGTFQVSAGVQIDIPEAESNAPILNAIASVARDVDGLSDDIDDINDNVGAIDMPAIPQGVSLAQISSALDAAVADVKSAVSGSQSAIEEGVSASEDSLEDAIGGIVEDADAAASGSSQAAQMALVAAVLAAIAVILQIVIIVRGNLLKN
jgi:hypothetical protein